MSSLVYPRTERRSRRAVDTALVVDIAVRLEAGQSQQAIARSLDVSQCLVWRVAKLCEVTT